MLGARTSVGATYSETKVVFPAVLLGIGIILLVCNFIWAWGAAVVLGPLTAVCAALLGAGCWSVARRQAWLTAYEDRFVYESASRTQETAYDAARAVQASLTTNYKEGLAESVTVRCTIWFDEPAAPLALSCVVKAGQQSPVLYVERQVTGRVLAAAQAAYGRGERVSGLEWTFSKQGLEFTRKGSAERLALADLSAVDQVDGAICVWRAGEAEPALRVPVESKNAVLLQPLLQAELEARPQSSSPPPPAEGLGRIIFERKSSAWGWFALGGVVAFVGIAFNGTSPAAMYTCFGLGLLSIPAWWMHRNPSFRCCELGVSQRYGQTELNLRYLDVEAFTYQATRHYHNGAYTGTAYLFKFEPREGKALVYQCTLNGEDDAMENLRSHISGVIAGRMANEVREGKEVSWTENLRFVPEGLECKPRGMLFGRKEPFLLRLGEIDGIHFEKGRMQIFARGDSKPIMDEAAAARNFFPGLALLEYLRAQLKQPANPGG